MTADIEGLFPGVQAAYELWANCMELVLAIYLLQRDIGWACFLVAVPAIGKRICSSLVVAMTFAKDF